MDIPVFSHTQVHLLKDGSLIVKKKTSEIIKNKIRKYIPKSILRLKQRVVHDYLLKSQSNQDVEMYNFYIKLLNQHDFIKDMFDLDKYDGDVRPLIMLVLYMHGIEEIGYDELVYE